MYNRKLLNILLSTLYHKPLSYLYICRIMLEKRVWMTFPLIRHTAVPQSKKCSLINEEHSPVDSQSLNSSPVQFDADKPSNRITKDTVMVC